MSSTGTIRHRKYASRNRQRLARILGCGAIVTALMASTMVLLAGGAGAAQAPVGLGTAAQFGVLAGSTVTNTGATNIGLSVGVSPGSAVTGFPPGQAGGPIHLGDAVAAQAQNDLTTAYNDAAGRAATQSVGAELGGLTLKPGVYSGPALQITGTLTLDAQGDPNAVFIFQASSTLITATSSRVSVINGAQACNTTWKVASSATLGTGSSMLGNILALTSITANNNAVIDGRLLARNGAVALDTNTVSSSGCITAPATTTTVAATSTSVATSTTVPGTTTVPVTTTIPAATTTVPAATTTVPAATTTIPAATTTVPAATTTVPPATTVPPPATTIPPPVTTIPPPVTTLPAATTTLPAAATTTLPGATTTLPAAATTTLPGATTTTAVGTATTLASGSVISTTSTTVGNGTITVPTAGAGLTSTSGGSATNSSSGQSTLTGGGTTSGAITGGSASSVVTNQVAQTGLPLTGSHSFGLSVAALALISIGLAMCYGAVRKQG